MYFEDNYDFFSISRVGVVLVSKNFDSIHYKWIILMKKIYIYHFVCVKIQLIFLIYDIHNKIT